jgi:uncharacterized protein YndB with AHSA1/START domain
MTENVSIERSYEATPRELWELWTSKEGFESWWGPQGFRVDVHKIEARLGGTLHYDMVPDSPEMIAAMSSMGEIKPTTCKGKFTVFAPFERLSLAQVIDFLPGVPAYESLIEVEFSESSNGSTRMAVKLSPMHDEQTSAMQREGFSSQLTKLDERFKSAA